MDFLRPVSSGQFDLQLKIAIGYPVQVYDRFESVKDNQRLEIDLFACKLECVSQRLTR